MMDQQNSRLRAVFADPAVASANLEIAQGCPAAAAKHTPDLVEEPAQELGLSSATRTNPHPIAAVKPARPIHSFAPTATAVRTRHHPAPD